MSVKAETGVVAEASLYTAHTGYRRCRLFCLECPRLRIDYRIVHVERAQPVKTRSVSILELGRTEG